MNKKLLFLFSLLLMIPVAATSCTVNVPGSVQNEPVSITTPEPVSYVTKYVTNTETLDIRENPANSASIICSIAVNTPVSFVQDSDNGYSKIVYNGVTGYALASYLTLQPPEEKPTAAPPAERTIIIDNSDSNRGPDHTNDEVMLEQLAVDSTIGFISAVNTGDFSYMSGYLDSDSAYYKQQKNAIADIHGRGVKESLISCSVSDIQWKDYNTCNMTQHTVIRCTYSDGTSKNVDETYTYLMRRSGSSFRYSKMYE